MREAERLKRESLRYALLVFAVFGLLFAGLGVFVRQEVAASLFQVVDEELFDYQGVLTATVLPLADMPLPAEQLRDPGETPIATFAPSSGGGMRAMTIMRDAAGGFAGALDAGGDAERALRSIPFDESIMERAYLVEADGRRYRVANFASDDAELPYVQRAADVGSEAAILERLTAALAVGLAAALVLTAVASYLLSRRTLRPIASAWEKQTEFVQNASHELRTPLAVIRTNQELLLDDVGAPVIDKLPCIDASIEEVSRLARLTDELLALTSSDAAATGLNVRMLDMGALAADMAASYEELAAAEGKALKAEAGGLVRVEADADKLRQLMAILLDNALKYTEPGDAIEVRVRSHGARAVVEVRDTGVGIAEEDCGRVFDRFYRADRARARSTGGNGLGLSIAKGIVEAHEGTIRMERNRPRGAAVIAEIPKRAV
ncbi:sensor histidine kinase [Eggerthella timonensis]|uniref:sensor histidine kinase n=1 Tax=Eggerthella timonensis TaxID=1871008 RepID=UPI000C76B2F0|nr:ATP-binding protein [Eggerthella timonensis]